MLFAVCLLCNFLHAAASAVVAVKQTNVSAMIDAFYQVSDPKSSQYGQYWTQEQIDDLVVPQDEIDQLLLDVEWWCAGDCVQKGAALVCEQLDAKCAIELSDAIEFIEVVHPYSIPQWDRPFPSPKGGGSFVAREVMVPLYNITYTSVLNGSSVCAVEYQNLGGFNQEDLQLQQRLNGQTKKPITNIVGANHGIMIETQLDIQMMSQVADGADVWFWGGEKWLYSFAVDFLNATHIPDVLSMSWGWSSRQQCDAGLGLCPNNMSSSAYIHRTNMEYVKMGLRGVTVTVSSGDAGAAGRTNEGCAMKGLHVRQVNPTFPGSSPFVTSVGATFLVPNQTNVTWQTDLCKKYGCASGMVERTCNFAEVGWTAGGGFAIYNETRPYWQNEVVEKYLKSRVRMPEHFQRGGRGYPDVTALGHDCPVINDGQLMGIDGTSCSSPVFASIVTLLNDYQVSKGKPKLGFVNPVLYKMRGAFKDITMGNNWCTESQCCNSSFGYEAAVGWDPVTGLGSPNFGKMAEWLDANT